MKQLTTQAIILTRTDFGEADRILTVFTPHYGKLRLLAKGVRRVKSKLAGGIELFSVSEITFIQGRGEIGTLVSTRLAKHYARIVQDLDRTMLGYELIKQLNKITEDEAEAEYFELLQQTFEALDDPVVSLDIIRLWFGAQLLRLGGHTPNLLTDPAGNKLSATQTYAFDFDAMAFTPAPRGTFTPAHIKFLRLSMSHHPAKVLQQVKAAENPVASCASLIDQLVGLATR